MKLNTEILIEKPIEDVFAYWADLERAHEWAVPVIERKKLTKGEVGIGTEYRAVDKFPGRQIKFIVRITAYKPNQYMAATWSEPIRGGWEATFTQSDNGTKMEIHAEMKPTGIMKLLSPIIKGWAKKGLQKDLRNFKDRLESE